MHKYGIKTYVVLLYHRSKTKDSPIASQQKHAICKKYNINSLARKIIPANLIPQIIFVRSLSNTEIIYFLFTILFLIWLIV